MKPRLKFSLKSIFVLTTLVAIAVYWIPFTNEVTCDFRGSVYKPGGLAHYPTKEIPMTIKFSTLQLLSFVSCIAIGMAIWPVYMNCQNLLFSGTYVPKHMTTTLTIAGGLMGGFAYIYKVVIKPWVNRPPKIGTSQCEHCGRMNAPTTTICPRCENKTAG